MRKLFIMILILGTISCGKKQTAETGTTTDPSTSTDTIVSSPLYIQVSASLENGGTKYFVGDCVIPANSTTGTVKACTISSPELLMYYSDYSFTVGTNTSDCTTVSFQPYYFIRSTSNSYLPNSTATSGLDCSTGALKDCYGGPAVDIAPDFPQYTGVYFRSEGPISSTYNVKSSNSHRSGSSSNKSYFTNTYITNNLADRATPISNSIIDYVGGGSFYDYTVTCRDKWAKSLFKIVLTINDDDTPNTTSSGANDEFYDWGN